MKDLRRLEAMRRRDRGFLNTKKRRARESAPESLSLVLGKMFNSPEARRSILESRALLLWPDLLGEPGTRFTEPLRVRGTTLVVRVTDPLWMQQLCLLKDDLLQRYRQHLPQLRLTDLFFVRK